MGFIYVVRVGESGPLKVGFSIEPRKRLYALQGAHYERLELIEVRRGHYLDEQHIHEELAPFALRGEWYSNAPEVLAAVAAVPHRDDTGRRIYEVAA